MQMVVRSMSDPKKWKSSQKMMDLFKTLGFEPEYQFSHEIFHLSPHIMILEAPAITEGFLKLDMSHSSKQEFLKHFAGGVAGPEKFVDARPWAFNGKLPNSSRMMANLYSDMGRDKNNKIYIDSGWIAFFLDGYSNMTLVEFWADPAPLANGRLNWRGKIYHGEKAFSKLNELDGREQRTNYPNSINRWVI